MTEIRKTVKPYEALELRAEYDGRIKTLRDCLPESRQKPRPVLPRQRLLAPAAPGFSLSDAPSCASSRIIGAEIRSKPSAASVISPTSSMMPVNIARPRNLVRRRQC